MTIAHSRFRYIRTSALFHFEALKRCAHTKATIESRSAIWKPEGITPQNKLYRRLHEELSEIAGICSGDSACNEYPLGCERPVEFQRRYRDSKRDFGGI